MLVFDFADGKGQQYTHRFGRARRVLTTRRAEAVPDILESVWQEVAAGRAVAGFVAYEAAHAFFPELGPPPVHTLPLIWFGVYEPTEIQRAPATPPQVLPLGQPFSAWQADKAYEQYCQDVRTIREAIAQGDVYQVNYTIRLGGSWRGDPWYLYQALSGRQLGAYMAFLDLGRHVVVSLSPECFFRLEHGILSVRPMKGTRPRGRFPAEDEIFRQELRRSPKERAENLMIVDLLRNDLGQVAEVGSVRVAALFEVERYPSVWQMTSTVVARPRPTTTLLDLFRALFPSGSVTGAPKRRALAWIRALEGTARGPYCGAIGYVLPGPLAVFNVAIRTLVLDRETGRAEYGVGGGITWDSEAEAEYREAHLKAACLVAPVVGEEEWSLVETMLLYGGRFWLEERHRRRIFASASYFGIPLTEAAWQAALAPWRSPIRRQPWKVRVLVARDGQVQSEGQPLPPCGAVPKVVAWSDQPVDRQDVFLFHKTTYRRQYRQQWENLPPGVFDVLHWNRQGEVTEFTNGNLLLEIRGQRYTPACTSGLLAGTLREELLSRGVVAERVCRLEDVAQAERLWFVNSVRGLIPVRLLTPLPPSLA